MYYICNNFKFYDELSSKLHNLFTDSSQNIVILGNYGLGKETFLEHFYNKYKRNYNYYNIVGDKLMPYGSNVKKYTCDFSIYCEFYAGISFNFSSNNNSLIENIINSFRKINKKNIILLIPNFQDIVPQIRFMIEIIINNKIFIEQSIKRNLNIIITESTLSNKNDYYSNFKKVFFNNYNVKDLKLYLQEIKKVDIAKVKDIDRKVNRILELTNSNLNIVNEIYKDLLFYKKDIGDLDLNSIITNRLNIIKQFAKTDNISSDIVEDVIFTCSLSYKTFSLDQINYMTSYDKNKILNILNLTLSEKLLREFESKEYDFLSYEIKKDISMLFTDKLSNKYLDYYNYLTLKKPDNYFLRGYYLYKSIGYIEENVLALFILTIMDFINLKDNQIIEVIKKITFTNNLYKSLVNKIFQCIEFVKNDKYLEANLLIENILNCTYSKTIKIILSYFKFKIIYSGKLFKNNDILVNNLISYILDDNIKLDLNGSYLLIDELSLKLKMIYDLSPYILDNKNDYILFQRMVEYCEVINDYFAKNNINCNSCNYVKYTFYRKAFLFSNPSTCNIYYEEAKNYFKKYNFNKQYIMTLIAQAGTNIANYEFDFSLSLINEALYYVNRNISAIPQIEKLYNNKIICQFLKCEYENGYNAQTIKLVKKSIQNLKKLLQTAKYSTKNVILTNIASLCLYIYDFNGYEETKEQIEESLNCDDVSNIYDYNVNDFYRYHFAWFEIFKNIHEKNWNKNNIIIDSLENFVPALFKKQEYIWDLKMDAIKKIVESNSTISSYDFCNKLVPHKHITNKSILFFSRGLMVSDLQFTSQD